MSALFRILRILTEILPITKIRYWYVRTENERINLIIYRKNLKTTPLFTFKRKNLTRTLPIKKYIIIYLKKLKSKNIKQIFSAKNWEILGLT